MYAELVVAIGVILLTILVWAYWQDVTTIPANKLGLPASKSNLKDQFTMKALSPPEKWKVKSLWIYPIKSCRGIEVDSCDVVETGLEHDRQFVFAIKHPDNEYWEFITQRTKPIMSQIHTFISSDLKTLTISYPDRISGNDWIPLMPGERRVQFSLPLGPPPEGKYPLRNVKVWNSIIVANDLSRLLPIDLRVLLQVRKGSELGLFRIVPGREKIIGRNAPTPEVLGREPQIGFADGYPCLLMNLSSVQDLNERLKSEIRELSILRFRPNIIVSGPDPYVEDHWKEVTIGGRLYHVASRCLRCKLPNVDPDTGIKHKTEPDNEMRKYRKIDEGNLLHPALGMNVVPHDAKCQIAVGDPVVVEKTGSHKYVDLLLPGQVSPGE